MKVSPILPDTIANAETQEWIPATFEGFLQELAHIRNHCKENNNLFLFRGQRNRVWKLDSTFARSFKKMVLGSCVGASFSSDVRDTFELHSMVLNSFLLKFGVIGKPCKELEQLAFEKNFDSWFEFMKYLQQYPEKEDIFYFLQGTNLMDWSLCSDVALYFANEDRTDEGAVFVCDTSKTGRTFMENRSVGDILKLMDEKGNSGKPLGVPLLFCPPNQIYCVRTKNQKARYFAQMDMRVDFEHIWKMSQKDNDLIYIKLVLPKDSMSEVDAYLAERGITKSFIYPDK